MRVLYLIMIDWCVYVLYLTFYISSSSLFNCFGNVWREREKERERDGLSQGAEGCLNVYLRKRVRIMRELMKA